MIRKKSNSQALFLSAILMLLLFIIPMRIYADEFEKVVSLEGIWKFSVGDNPEWAAESYDDTDWDIVTVPESWEANGYDDYNGFAWYRKTFMVTGLDPDRNYFLLPGYIDDTDEVYLNGKLIGKSGTMPPLVVTAHDTYRQYYIPKGLLRENALNLLAVRVYDEYERGGIYSGPVGIFYNREEELLTVNLSGYWDFEDFKKPVDSVKRIFVPGYWENQGYPDLDGSASYLRTFEIPAGADAGDLMLVMGYIDDLDKVFINGVRVGAREYRENNYERVVHMDVIFRGYEIPPGTLKLDAENIIEVRVVDKGGLGGIYRGPVGLVTKSNYRRILDNHSSINSFEQFINYLFGWD